jgi:hypothetical protein
MDEYGRLMPHFANDSRGIEWNNSILVNHRKKTSWDELIRDMKVWVNDYQVGGILLDHAHIWPLNLEPDMKELMRCDPDGMLHYSLQYGPIIDHQSSIINQQSSIINQQSAIISGTPIA